jgi:hypothetical protein
MLRTMYPNLENLESVGFFLGLLPCDATCHAVTGAGLIATSSVEQTGILRSIHSDQALLTMLCAG